MKNKIMLSGLLLAATSFLNLAHAGTISCTTDTLTLDSVSVIGDVTDTNLLTSSHNATDCEGMFRGHDDTQGRIWDWPTGLPDRNIGELNDGLLNGEGRLFDGMEFIEEEDLQDLDGDGNATDPGWIHLANVTNKFGHGFTADYDELGSEFLDNIVIDISDVLTLTLSCTNDFFGFCTDGFGWELETKLNVIEDVQSVLGEATFDHLAFSINSFAGFGSTFGVYDLNFADIFEQENNPALNFNTPYKLSGTFNMGDFPKWRGGEYDPAHINVWARDPAEASVPEPSTLAVFALGIFGLIARKYKSTK